MMKYYMIFVENVLSSFVSSYTHNFCCVSIEFIYVLSYSGQRVALQYIFIINFDGWFDCAWIVPRLCFYHHFSLFNSPRLFFYSEFGSFIAIAAAVYRFFFLLLLCVNRMKRQCSSVHELATVSYKPLNNIKLRYSTMFFFVFFFRDEEMRNLTNSESRKNQYLHNENITIFCPMLW